MPIEFAVLGLLTESLDKIVKVVVGGGQLADFKHIPHLLCFLVVRFLPNLVIRNILNAVRSMEISLYSAQHWLHLWSKQKLSSQYAFSAWSHSTA